jgi:hypothetical protein
MIEKLQNYLDNYVDQATPVDLPESSPANPLTGPGRTGV